MKFEIPTDYCSRPTDQRKDVLHAAENALREMKQVYFQGKHFTNFDELNTYLSEQCHAISVDNDWPGAITG